jgi:hypothetical protein
MVKAQQCMVAVRQKWQRAAVLLDWPLADSVPSVSLWPYSKNIVKKYTVSLYLSCFYTL